MKNNRAAATGHRQIYCFGYGARQLFRQLDHFRQFRYPREDRYLVDLLKSVFAEIGSLNCAGDNHQRRVGEVRFCHSGCEIRHARPGLGRQSDAGHSAYARVRVGHEAGGPLVSCADVSDFAAAID